MRKPHNGDKRFVHDAQWRALLQHEAARLILREPQRGTPLHARVRMMDRQIQQIDQSLDAPRPVVSGTESRYKAESAG